MALFAHCFTCGKDIRAASEIASRLTDRGFAVLRFDFTGLGSSEGEFANTNFTSNVDDLVAAAKWLRERFVAPQVLIGHSLGGAAVLVAASRIPEVDAVVTIGAPSDAAHLTELFAESIDEICEVGEATVTLAGRTFAIRDQFVQDLESSSISADIAAFRGALLVMHSPTDETVSIDQAAGIYAAAGHPKSFVALDGADHLLGRKADAQYAAEIIAAWAGRYLEDLSGSEPAPEPTAQVVVAETTQGLFLNHVVMGSHRLLADEPESIGGFDAGPSPYDLLGAALGACTSMTLRMYADRKRLPLDRVTVEISHDRIHADDASADAHDAATSERQGAQIDRFTRRLRLDGDLDDAMRSSLKKIADRCPVHRTLEASSRIETELA